MLQRNKDVWQFKFRVGKSFRLFDKAKTKKFDHIWHDTSPFCKHASFVKNLKLSIKTSETKNYRKKIND